MSGAPKSADLAWFNTPASKVAMQVHAWGIQPSPGGCSFYAPDFALAAAQPWLLGEERDLEFDPQPLPLLVARAEPSSADFARMHEEILERIERREFQKVVPIVCEELEFEEPLHAGMFAAAMLEKREAQFSYGFEFGGEGLSGVTPELLFSVENGVLKTMALAGTGRSDGPSLLDDKKEMLEHRLVIDHIATELRHWGKPEVGETVERTYGALKHLYTPLTLQLNELPKFMELIVRLHPTAALGGWPRKPAVEWLERQEFHAGRRRFGAPFGYIRGEDMSCVVAIRCLQWQKVCAQLAAGCGVVAGSQSLREWNELQLKRNSICKLLDLNL